MKNLKHFDRFGFSYTLTTFGQTNFKTPLGACLTLIAAAVGAVIFLFLGKDFFQKKNPIVTKNDKVHEEPLFTNLSKEVFPFMVNISYDLKEFNSPSRPYKILVEYIDSKLNSDSSYETTCQSFFDNSTPCLETSLKDHPYYKEKDLKNWMCIDISKIEKECKEKTKNNEYQVEIGGLVGDKFLKYFRISVLNYNLSADRKAFNVATDEELKLKEDVRFQIRYPKYYFDNESVENAFKTIFDQEVNIIDRNTWKLEFKFFNAVTLFDDQGFLSESIEKQNSLKLEFTRSDFYSSKVGVSNNRMFHQTLIQVNKNEQQFKRRFFKVQDVIAVSINFIKSCAAACYLINIYFSTGNRTKKLIEKLFDTKTDQVEQSLEMKVNTVVSKVNLKELKKPEEQVGWIERIIFCCRKKIISKSSKEFFMQGEKYIANCFEVVSIIQLFKNFEKLKEMTLTEEEKEELEGQNRIEDKLVN